MNTDATTIPDPPPLPQEMPTLAEMVAQLAVLRRMETAAKAQLEKAETAFRIENAALYRNAERSKEDRAQLEETVRALAITEHLMTGDKHPAPGISIRITPKWRYEEREALRWAIQHEPDCLSLRKAAFEAICKTRPLPFVTVENVSVPALDADLAGAVERARREGGAP